MEDYRYWGAYASFVPAGKTQGELLQGADFLVGDVFDFEFRAEGDVPQAKGKTSGLADDASDEAAGQTGISGEIAWVRNRFGGYAGALDAQTSRTLRIMMARGWTCRALLSFVAFTDSPEPGFYWGQVACVCYDPLLADVFEPWLRALGEKMAEGARVQVALTVPEIDRVIESGGTWLPEARADIPSPADGKTAVLKRSRSASEKLIELGRDRRPGCMVVGWAFNIALAAGVVALILHLCGVF